MRLIFDKYMDKSFDGDMLLSHAYAVITEVKPIFVKLKKDMTIQEYVNASCRKLIKEGKDLDQTSVEEVAVFFDDIEFTIEYPPAYKTLVNNLSKAKLVLEKLKTYKHASKQMVGDVENTVTLLQEQVDNYG